MSDSAPRDRRQRRRFNTSERVALYLAADGCCANCGADLEPGWHADHVHPYAQGGATDVINGQALCPTCNLSKGARVTDFDHLRDWQRAAMNRYVTGNPDRFLVQAVPGSGKTTLALTIASHLLKGTVDRVFVVCPTAHLKKQWQVNAHRVGIELAAGWKNVDGRLATDYHGAVVTYQQVCSQPDFHRHEASGRTLVIFDEIHHAGDEATWGAGLRIAYGAVARCLMLTGTPIRTDGTPIPFITYDSDGVPVPDFKYGQREAIRDRVCRPTCFPAIGGTAKWESGGRTFQKTFEDELGEQRRRERMRTALDPSTDFPLDLIRGANEQLAKLRADDPTAGGLVIARDRDHARRLADGMARLVGRRPPVVVSDDPDDLNPSAEIERFEASDEPWLVAVRMVSEGVDIPRLRVLAYLTNTQTELFFRQAVGRVTRYQRTGPPAQMAYCYILADETLIALAERINSEIIDGLQERTDKDNDGSSPADGSDPTPSSFVALEASGKFAGFTIDGDSSSAAELRAVRQQLRNMGRPVPEPRVAHEMVLLLRGNGIDLTCADVDDDPVMPGDAATLDEQKERASGEANRLVGRYCKTTGADFSHVHADLNRQVGIRSGSRSSTAGTLDQLQRKVALARQLIAGLVA